MIKILILLFTLLFYFINITKAFAHEAYVLPKNQFEQELKIFTKNSLAPLFDPANIQLFTTIAFIIALSYVLSILFATTNLASNLNKHIKKIHITGPFTIRLAIGSSLLLAASSNSIFGPELSLSQIPQSEIISFFTVVISIMLLLGLLTEIAAIASLSIFLLSIFYFGFYMITYVNYLGEIIVLILFGSRFLSLDKLLFGHKLHVVHLEKFKHLEIPVVRILYGIGLIYTAFSIKFLHQNIPIAVYEQYNLRQFFQLDATFIAAGAALSEFLIGFFILIGFAQRLTITILLIFITLSLLYFREMVWPHLMLYGISISLFINSGDLFTVDHYLIPYLRSFLAKTKKIL